MLDGLVAGQANKVIACDLGISPRTVEIYRANVMTKMQARACPTSCAWPCSAGNCDRQGYPARQSGEREIP